MVNRDFPFMLFDFTVYENDIKFLKILNFRDLE